MVICDLNNSGLAKLCVSFHRDSEGGLAPGSSDGGESGGVTGGPKTPQQIAAQRRLQQTQAQVDEVSYIDI